MRLTKTDIAGLVFVGCSLVAQDAYSDTFKDAYLDIHIASHHFATEPYYQYSDGTRVYENWNETNQGIGLDVGIDDHVSLMAGYIENSYDVTDWYAGADIHTDRSGDGFVAGVSLMYAPGYENTPSPSMLPLPNLSYQYGPVRAKISGFPGEFVGLTISWRLK